MTATSVGNRFVLPGGEPLTLEYVGLAAALGCLGIQADDRAELERALAQARAGRGTTLIHCRTVDGELPPSGAFWDLGVPEVAKDPAARRRLEETHERRRAVRQRPLP
jgi:3D-(3,5/4)-trihydroxycyclohexane-1,2-dione acylhydrolase (decyclizing)